MAKNTQKSTHLNRKGMPRKAPPEKAAHLKAYRWKPGQASPNPSGRPKKISGPLEEFLRRKVKDDPQDRSYFELLVEAAVKRAITKSDTLVMEIFNRIEGRVGSVEEETDRSKELRVIVQDIPRPHKEPIDIGPTVKKPDKTNGLIEDTLHSWDERVDGAHKASAK